MTRLFPAALMLVLVLVMITAACAPIQTEPAATEVTAAPKVLKHTPHPAALDPCAPGDDGIGGTGCKED